MAVSGMFLEVSKLVSRHRHRSARLHLAGVRRRRPDAGLLLARELGMRRVVVPVTPGVLSAFGELIADVQE